MYGFEAPICPECNIEMTSYCKPQDPYFVCSTCNGNHEGFEVGFCDCGSPCDSNGDCRDDCSHDLDECESCGENEVDSGVCNNCGYDVWADEDDD